MELDSLKDYNSRHVALRNWYESEEPCVMIIGYDMFRILTQDDDDRVIFIVLIPSCFEGL